MTPHNQLAGGDGNHAFDCDVPSWPLNGERGGILWSESVAVRVNGLGYAMSTVLCDESIWAGLPSPSICIDQTVSGRLTPRFTLRLSNTLRTKIATRRRAHRHSVD